jgi:hypothetical protein
MFLLMSSPLVQHKLTYTAYKEEGDSSSLIYVLKGRRNRIQSDLAFEGTYPDLPAKLYLELCYSR